MVTALALWLSEPHDHCCAVKEDANASKRKMTIYIGEIKAQFMGESILVL